MSAHAVARLLLDEPMNGPAIAQRLGLSYSTVAEHLRRLKREGLATLAGRHMPLVLTESGIRFALATPPAPQRDRMRSVVEVVEEEPSSTTAEIAADLGVSIVEADGLLTDAEARGLLTSAVVRGSTVWTVRRAA